MNLGNTCYMNVIVQILCNLPSFVNSMESFFGPIVSQNALEVSSLHSHRLFQLSLSFLLGSSMFLHYVIVVCHCNMLYPRVY